MEDMMVMISNKKQSQSSSSGRGLGIQKDSHKMKPKVRIIHIFAPEIIKTDVENFRELVQRLTGKPSHQQRLNKKSSQKKPEIQVKEEEEMWKSNSNSGGFLSGFSDLDGFIQQLDDFSNHMLAFGETQLA